MGKYCDHEFITVATRKRETSEEHAIIVCHYCGQVKQVCADGNVFILKLEGELKKAYATPSPNTNNGGK